MRTQQLFHLQKALVMHGGNGAEGGDGGDDQVCATASDESTFPGVSDRSNLDRRVGEIANASSGLRGEAWCCSFCRHTSRDPSGMS